MQCLLNLFLQEIAKTPETRRLLNRNSKSPKASPPVIGKNGISLWIALGIIIAIVIGIALVARILAGESLMVDFTSRNGNSTTDYLEVNATIFTIIENDDAENVRHTEVPRSKMALRGNRSDAISDMISS